MKSDEDQYFNGSIFEIIHELGLWIIEGACR